MHDQTPSQLDATPLRIAIAVSRYHNQITDSMCNAAKEVFLNAGGRPHNLRIVDVAGSWELTAICRALAAHVDRSGRPNFDAIVAIGCIITGETTHDQYIAQSVVRGLTDITVQSGIPIAFGVLTCQSIEQARERAGLGSKSSKGAEAMRAAIQSATTIRMIQTSRAFR